MMAPRVSVAPSATMATTTVPCHPRQTEFGRLYNGHDYRSLPDCLSHPTETDKNPTRKGERRDMTEPPRNVKELVAPEALASGAMRNTYERYPGTGGGCSWPGERP
jgi:hypothetical protein